MIERHPNPRWELFTWGRANVAFQRHVVVGLGTEDPKFITNIDIGRMVAMYASDHRVPGVDPDLRHGRGPGHAARGSSAPTRRARWWAPCARSSRSRPARW